MQRPTESDESSSRRFQSPTKQQKPVDDTSYYADETNISLSPQLDPRRPVVDQSIHPDRPTAPPPAPVKPVAGASAFPPHTPAESPIAGKRWSMKKMFTERFKRDKTPKAISYEDALQQALKHQECQNMLGELVAIINQYDRRYGWELRDDPSLVVTAIQEIIERLDISKRQVDIKLDMVKGLPGTQLSYEVKKLQKRISEIIEDFNSQTKIMAVEISKKNDEIIKLRAESAADKKLVQQCRLGNLSVNKQAVAHLRATVVEKEVKNQLLVEQINLLRAKNQSLEEIIKNLNSKNANLLMEAMKKYVDVIKEFKYWANDEIYKYVTDRLSEYTGNRDELLKTSTEDFIKGLEAALENVKDQIEDLRITSRLLEDEYAQRFLDVQNLSHKCDNLSSQASYLEELAAIREEQNRRLRSELDQIQSYPVFKAGVIKASTPRSIEQSWDPARESPEARALRASSPKSSDISWDPAWESPEARAVKTSSPKSSDISWDPAWESPEVPRWGSPGVSHAPENILDVQSMSLEDSGPVPVIPSLTITPPSPMRSPNIFTSSARSNIIEAQALSQPQSKITFDPLTQTMIPIPIGPEIQTLSEPQSILTIDPSIQNISNVTNRFEVGRSLNMHTVHSGSPSPYHQLTRVDSIISPQPGPSRMLDNPLYVQHRADVTPLVYKTPWISTQSRYGYTDPSFKMLNLPPGAFVEMNTALKKRLMLTSPQREEPLLVNIGVDPKPLVQTETGEHFICDISLDVQQAGKSRPAQISPVHTLEVPPAIAPAADRRQGLFTTPPGIFKRQERHYNVRRIEDEFDDSPGKYFSPHYLPHDGRSPVSHISLSPVSLLHDRSISWERIPGIERTPSPVIRGPSWAYPGYIPSPFTESSPEESPVIKGIIDINSTDFSDSSFERTPPSPRPEGTFERSPSPVIRGFADMSSPPSTAGSFVRSPSPVIRGPSWAYPGYIPSPFTESSLEESPVIKGIIDINSTDFSDSSFERTPPSPRHEGTFERSPSPVIRGFADMSSSPSTDGSFVRSPSPVIRGFADMSSSPSTAGSFVRSPSPVIRGFVDMSSSPSTYGGFERSPSPVIRGFADMSSSLSSAGSSVRSPSPVIRGFADMSSSPSTYGSFERSTSPQMNRTFERSLTPMTDRSSDRSQSFRLDGSIDPLNRVNRFRGDSGGYLDMISPPLTDESFERTASPQMNRTFESSTSQMTDGSFDRSLSPRFDGSFQRSPSPLNRVHRFRGDGRGYLDMSSSLSNDGSFGRSPSPRLDGSFQRSPSPLSRVHRFRGDGRGYLEIDSSLSNDGSFDRSVSPLSNRTFERSISPVSNRTFDSSGHSHPLYASYDSHAGRLTHYDPFYDGISAQTLDSQMYGPSEDEFSRSMPSDGSFSHSVSPRTYYSSWSSSSGYDNPFNPNNSELSPSGLSPHILNSSMPPRLGGVFNENPSRLTRTI